MKIFTRYLIISLSAFLFASCSHGSGIPSQSQVRRRKSENFYQERKERRLQEAQQDLRLLNDRL